MSRLLCILNIVNAYDPACLGPHPEGDRHLVEVEETPHLVQ